MIRLVETGTQVSAGTILTPSHCGEYPFAPRLIRSAPSNALVLMDRGFYRHTVLKEAFDQRMHLLVRVALHVNFKCMRHRHIDFSRSSLLCNTPAAILPTHSVRQVTTILKDAQAGRV